MVEVVQPVVLVVVGWRGRGRGGVCGADDCEAVELVEDGDGEAVDASQGRDTGFEIEDVGLRVGDQDEVPVERR